MNLARKKVSRGPLRVNAATLADPVSPDAWAWSRISRAYDKLVRRLRAIMAHEGVSPTLKAELLRHAQAHGQLVRHAAERASTLEADAVRGGGA